MLIKHRNHDPNIDSSSYIAPTAVAVGRVNVDSDSRIMYGAVLDSEESAINVGKSTIICENAVLRATKSKNANYPVFLGDDVFVGPHTTLLGCSIGSCVYLATGVTVLHGAKVQSGAIIAVGALVHANTVVPTNAFIPPYSIAIGDPMRIYNMNEQEEVSKAIREIGFAKIAFDIKTSYDDPARNKQITKMRSKEFKAHFDDVILY